LFKETFEVSTVTLQHVAGFRDVTICRNFRASHPKTQLHMFQKTQHFAILNFVLCHLHGIKLPYLLSAARNAANTNAGSRAA